MVKTRKTVHNENMIFIFRYSDHLYIIFPNIKFPGITGSRKEMFSS